jgi:hypothetical protein
MVLRCVFLVLLLHQAATRWIQYSGIYCQMHVVSCHYVPSCQIPHSAAPRGPGSAMLICLRGAPGSMRKVGWANNW